MVEHQVDELRELAPHPELLAGGDSLKRQGCVGRGAQGHESLHRTLEFQQEEDSSTVEGVRRPDEVGMALLQRLLADQLSRLLAQRREIEFTGPFTRVVPDEDLHQPAVGEDRLEEGIVHDGSGIGGNPNLAGIRGRTNGWMGR